jgi:hypothetical protein
MKSLLILVLLSLSIPVRAESHQGSSLLTITEAEESEVLETESDVNANSIRVKDIREALKTMDLSTTCMDEMVKRRGQLIWKLSLAPLSSAGIFTGAIASGAYLGKTLATLHGNPSGWADLAGAVTGMFLGGLGSIIYAGTDTTVAAVRLSRLQLLLKALGEQRLDRSGIYSEKLYRSYEGDTKSTPMSRARFYEKLVEADQTGALCDGSMVKKRMIRIGTHLKFKVANSHDFIQWVAPAP